MSPTEVAFPKEKLAIICQMPSTTMMVDSKVEEAIILSNTKGTMAKEVEVNREMIGNNDTVTVMSGNKLSPITRTPTSAASTAKPQTAVSQVSKRTMVPSLQPPLKSGRQSELLKKCLLTNHLLSQSLEALSE